MLIKFYKSIHNKYSKIFKFFFYLTHLVVIFVISFGLFLSIPKFYDQAKKKEIIKNFLMINYGLELKRYDTIDYRIFPYPNFFFKNIQLKIKDTPILFTSKNFNIFLDLSSIYNTEVIQKKKISFNDLIIFSDIDRVNDLLSHLIISKNKFSIKKSSLNLLKENKTILTIKDIKYSNFGLKKNQISGKIFDKEFDVSIKNSNKIINFKILKTGINALIILDDTKNKKLISGSSKINILDNFLKFDFDFVNGELRLKDSSFRNKDFSAFLNGILTLKPFFKIDTVININKLNYKVLEEISLEKISLYKNFIIKINGNNKINYKIKRFNRNIINNIFLDTNLEFGRLEIESEIAIPGGNTTCKSETLITEEYPRLYFDCNFSIQNKKKLFDKISIKNKFSNDPFILKISGNLNILNNKVNFKNIKIDNSYVANDEDLKYFKDTFEKILFNENFLKIFKSDKIKDFLLEIM